MIILDNQFDFFDIVYLKTDDEQLSRVITQISVTPSGAILYELTCGVQASEHYEQEIVPEKSLIQL